MFFSSLDRKFSVGLDINPNIANVIPQTITFSTNDRKTSVIEFTINNNNEPIDITGSNITMFIVKPSKNVSLETVHVVDGINGVAQVELKNDSVLEEGNYTCEIRMQKGEEVVVANPFIYTVFQAMQVDEVIETDDNFSALTDIIADAQEVLNTESTRIRNENTRVNNENQRIDNETNRRNAETKREQKMSGYESRFNQMVASGTTNQEVVDARGQYTVLRDRINALEERIRQLEQIEDVVTGLVYSIEIHDGRLVIKN